VADRIKFHPSTGSGHRLDEHVDPDIARALRRYGIDVTTTVDAGLRTDDDPAHLDFIRREGRVVVTHDADFLRYASQSSDHPGIAYCHMSARSMAEIIRSLILMYEVLTPEEIAGHVEYL
jgi:predicted nuclease of predicted toxin-antitoxin system